MEKRAVLSLQNNKIKEEFVMWNPFKKKDPMKEIAGVGHLAETFLPQLVNDFNAGKYEECIFTDIRAWKEMLKVESENLDFRFKKITAVSTDFKKNHDVCLVLIKWPEVKWPTMAKACMIVIDRPTHQAKQYILESSLRGSMIIEMSSQGRMNTCITIPADEHELEYFMMEVVKREGIRWK